MGGGRGGKLVSLMIFSLPPCGVCRSPVPSVYSINYKRKKNKAYMAGQTPFFGDFPATWPNFGAEALAVAEAAPLAREDFC